MARPEKGWWRPAYRSSGKRTLRDDDHFDYFAPAARYDLGDPDSSLLFICFPMELTPPERMIEIPIWPDLPER